MALKKRERRQRIEREAPKHRFPISQAEWNRINEFRHKHDLPALEKLSMEYELGDKEPEMLAEYMKRFGDPKRTAA